MPKVHKKNESQVVQSREGPLQQVRGSATGQEDEISELRKLILEQKSMIEDMKRRE